MLNPNLLGVVKGNPRRLFKPKVPWVNLEGFFKPFKATLNPSPKGIPTGQNS